MSSFVKPLLDAPCSDFKRLARSDLTNPGSWPPWASRPGGSTYGIQYNTISHIQEPLVGAPFRAIAQLFESEPQPHSPEARDAVPPNVQPRSDGRRSDSGAPFRLRAGPHGTHGSASNRAVVRKIASNAERTASSGCDRRIRARDSTNNFPRIATKRDFLARPERPASPAPNRTPRTLTWNVRPMLIPPPFRRPPRLTPAPRSSHDTRPLQTSARPERRP